VDVSDENRRLTGREKEVQGVLQHNASASSQETRTGNENGQNDTFFICGPKGALEDAMFVLPAVQEISWGLRDE